MALLSYYIGKEIDNFYPYNKLNYILNNIDIGKEFFDVDCEGELCDKDLLKSFNFKQRKFLRFIVEKKNKFLEEKSSQKISSIDFVLLFSGNNNIIKGIKWALLNGSINFDQCLYGACRFGHFDIIKWLINNKKYVDIERAFGYACGGGHLEIAKWLLIQCEQKRKNKIFNLETFSSDYKIVALYLACHSGHLEIIKWLISLTNIESNKFRGCFCVACESGHLEVAKWILSFTKINVKTIEQTLANVCDSGYLEIAKWLITLTEKKLNFEIALYCACYGGHFKIAKWIIKNGETDFNQALCGACLGGHLKCAKWAVKNGATDFYSALDSACAGENLKIVKWLLPIFNGTKSSTIKVDSTIVEYINDGKYFEPFITACSTGNLEIVKFLILNKANIHDTSEKPLIEACRNEHLEVVKILVSNGADIHTCNDFPLSLAREKGNLDIIKYLITNGANIENQCGIFKIYNECEKERFCRICDYWNPEMIKPWKINMNANENPNINKILLIACEYGYLNMIKFLFSRNIINYDYDTALRLAIENKHHEIVDFLKKCQ